MAVRSMRTRPRRAARGQQNQMRWRGVEVQYDAGRGWRFGHAHLWRL